MGVDSQWRGVDEVAIIEAKGEIFICAADVNDHAEEACLRCQMADGALLACLENVSDGNMEVQVDQFGAFRFRLTEAGKERADLLRSTDPEMMELWERMEQSKRDEAGGGA